MQAFMYIHNHLTYVCVENTNICIHSQKVSERWLQEKIIHNQQKENENLNLQTHKHEAVRDSSINKVLALQYQDLLWYTVPRLHNQQHNNQNQHWELSGTLVIPALEGRDKMISKGLLVSRSSLLSPRATRDLVSKETNNFYAWHLKLSSRACALRTRMDTIVKGRRHGSADKAADVKADPLRAHTVGPKKFAIHKHVRKDTKSKCVSNCKFPWWNTNTHRVNIRDNAKCQGRCKQWGFHGLIRA